MGSTRLAFGPSTPLTGRLCQSSQHTQGHMRHTIWKVEVVSAWFSFAAPCQLHRHAPHLCAATLTRSEQHLGVPCEQYRQPSRALFHEPSSDNTRTCETLTITWHRRRWSLYELILGSFAGHPDSSPPAHLFSRPVYPLQSQGSTGHSIAPLSGTPLRPQAALPSACSCPCRAAHTCGPPARL